MSDRFHIDPLFHRQQLLSSSLLHQLAQKVLVGATLESTRLPEEQFVVLSGEMLRMMVNLLEHAFSQPPPTQGGDSE